MAENLYDRMNNQNNVSDVDLSIKAPVSAKPTVLTPFDTMQQSYAAKQESDNRINRLLNTSLLRDSEKPIVLKAMALASENGENPEEVKEKMIQASLFSQNYDNLPFSVALSHLDELSEYQLGQKAQFTQTWSTALANSFRIGNIATKISALGNRYESLLLQGEDVSEIDAEIKELKKQQESLYDYADRGLITDLLKGVVQTLPYMGKIAGATAVGSLISPGFGTALGFIQGVRMTNGSIFYDLVQDGVDTKIAAWTAGISSGIQSAIEMLVGNEAMITGAITGSPNKFYTKIMGNLLINGKFNKWAFGAMALVNASAEGAEEFEQTIVDDVAANIAYNLSGVDKKREKTIKSAVQDGIMGFGTALILGIVPTAINMNRFKKVPNTREAIALRDDARVEDSKEAFVDKWAKDSGGVYSKTLNNLLGDNVKESDKRQILSDVWENNHVAQNENVKTNLETIDVDTDINDDYSAEDVDESGNPVAPAVSEQPTEPVQRLENGRLRTQESKNYSENPDGTESHTLNIGQPNSPTRYGHIDYTLNPETNTLTIDTVATKQGYESDITKDSILELARQHEGWNIEWNPRSEAQNQIKQQIINENPNNNGSLQWFNIKSDNDTVLATSKVIKTAFPNLTREESAVGTRLLELMATSQGKDLKTWFNDHIQGFNKIDQKGVKGAITFDEKGIKAIISAGKSADITTFSHEVFHSAIRTSEKAGQLASALKESVNTDQFKKYVNSHKNIIGMDYDTVSNAIKDMGDNPLAWNREQQEIAATLFEGYLKDGKTFNEKLKNIFSLIADWFKRVYQTLKNEGVLNDSIIKAYDEIVAGNPTLQQSSDVELDTLYQKQNLSSKNELLADFKEQIDDVFKNRGKSKYKFLNIANVSDVYKNLGLDGDVFSVKRGTIVRHIGKENHLSSTNEWKTLAEEINNPIGYFKDDEGKYHFYFDVKKDDNTLMMLVEEKNINKTNKIENIITAFYKKNFERDLAEGKIKKINQSSVRRNQLSIALPTSTDSNDSLKLNNSDVKTLNQTDLTESENFKNWFKDSKVVDENGKPLVVYHGTPNGEFDIFDRNKGSVESDMGNGFYFTSNEYDVSNNYEGGGPDFENKIARLAEQIEQDEDISYEEAKEKARKQLFVGANKYAVYLKMENPAYVRNTYIFEDAIDLSDITEDDFNSYEDYEEELNNARDDRYAELVDEIVWEAGNTLDFDADKLKGILWDAIVSNFSIPQLKEELISLYSEDENGNLADNEILRIAIEKCGFDGIIDDTVSEKFKNMNLESDTVHYIVFKNNQIKSATDNDGQFDPNNPSILHQLDPESENNLITEAKDFESREEFILFENAMSLEELSDEDLGTIWDKAHNLYDAKNGTVNTSNMTEDEKDNLFNDIMNTDEGVKAFITRLREAFNYKYDVMRNGGNIGVNSESEYQDIIRQVQIADRVDREAAPYISSLAKGNKDINESHIKEVRGIVQNSLRDYRQLYAEVIGNEDLTVGMYNEYMPDIRDSRTQGMRITERKELAKRLEGEQIRDAILKGTEKFDGTAEKLMAVYDKEIADLNSQLDKLNNQYRETYRKLSVAEQDAVNKQQKISQMESAIKKARQNVRNKLDSGRRVSTEQLKKLNDWEDQVNLLNDEIKELREQDRVKASLKNKEAIDRIKSEIREKQKAKAETEEVHNYKRELFNSIVAPVSQNVDYSYNLEIQKVIGTLKGVQGYQNSNITIDGKRMSLDEYRKAVDEGKIKIENLNDYQLRRYLNTSLADLTVEDLETLSDTVNYFKRMGKQMWQAKVDQRAFESEQLRNQIINNITKSRYYKPEKDVLPGTAESLKKVKSDSPKGGIYKTWNWARKAQLLDGDNKGTAYDLTVEEKRVHEDEFNNAVRDRVNRIKSLMDTLGVKEEELSQNVQVQFPDGRVATYNPQSLAYILYADKNPRNYNAVAYGTLVSQAEKERMYGTDNARNKQIELLGDSRYKSVKAQAENYFNENPNLKKVVDAIIDDWNDKEHLKRLNDVMLNEYNKPVDVESFYMTMKRQDFNGSDSASRVQDDMYNLNAGKSRTTPDQGITKSRIDISPINQQPVDLNLFRVWLDSVYDQENIIANLSYVRKLNSVFKNYGSKGVRSAIDNAFGRAMQVDLDNYINEVANARIFTDTQEINGIFDKLRGGVYTGYLGWKLSGIVLQGITSPMPTLQYVNPVQLAKGLMQMTFHPVSTWNFIKERSSYMESRSMNPMIEATKNWLKTSTDKKLVDIYHKFLEVGTEGLEAVDRWAVSGSWMAVYDKKLKELGDISSAENQKQAAHFADNFIRDTQPSGNVTDLAPLFKSKNSAAKVLTQFTTSLNVIWNNITFDLPQAVKHHDFRLAVGTVFGYALAGLLLSLVQEGFDDDDKPEDIAKKLIYGMTTQFTQSVPLLGSLVDSVTNTLVTGENGFAYNSNQLYPGISYISKGIADVRTKGLKSTAIKNLSKGVALFAGLPTSGASEIWQTFFDKGLIEAIEKGDLNFEFKPGRLLGRRDY